MIKVIKDNSKELKMKCYKCDSEFTYALEDVEEPYKDKPLGPYDVPSLKYLQFIKCPVCGAHCNHKDRIKEN